MSAHIDWHVGKKEQYLIADLSLLDEEIIKAGIELDEHKKEGRNYLIKNKIVQVKAYFYDFQKHPATIALQPINGKRYKVCLLYADGEKFEVITDIFATFLEAILDVNEDYPKKKEEITARDKVLLSKAELS